jgi:hypothetical protein
MIQANPSMTVDVIKQLLEQTAIDLGDPGKDNDYGFGRVNCFTAVTAALAGVAALFVLGNLIWVWDKFWRW